MSFGQATRNRFEQLRKMGQNVPKIMEEVAEGATIAAVERAAEAGDGAVVAAVVAALSDF